MRILLAGFAPFEGATTAAIREGLAPAYARLGHHVTAAAPSAVLRASSETAAPWGRAVRLGGGQGSTLRRLAASARELGALAREADLVHFHASDMIGPALEPVARAFAGARVVLTFQDFANPSRNLGLLPRSRSGLDAFASRCAAVTALSSMSARMIAAELPLMGARVSVVPNGVDPQPARALRTPRAGVVLCAARLAYYKAIDVLLMAWADVEARLPGARLVLAGTDHENGRYHALAARLRLRGVRFAGELERAELLALMRSCLLVALPSRHEAFGMAALEAMACAKPVIAARGTGTAEFVEHGRTGLLVQPGDVESLREALLALLSDPARRARMGRTARARSGRYSWDAAAAAYLALAERALGSKGVSRSNRRREAPGCLRRSPAVFPK